ncbi:unnamed protein product [Ixodes pacificus]
MPVAEVTHNIGRRNHIAPSLDVSSPGRLKLKIARLSAHNRNLARRLESAKVRLQEKEAADSRNAKIFAICLPLIRTWLAEDIEVLRVLQANHMRQIEVLDNILNPSHDISLAEDLPGAKKEVNETPIDASGSKTPFEFHDGESAGTIPYMAPEILKRRPYGRSADWWSVGIVMYKLMTGRVPFRGKTKQMLRERIITAPLKWPRVEEHKHSATTPAKDMTYRMLKKNPVDRLGSVNYNELKTHPFFDRFNWQVLYTNTDLCDIPSIAEILKSNAEKGGKGGDPEDKRRHQRIEEMIDVTNETQKPLLCYSSSSFKKLMTKVKGSKTAIKVSETFMETSDITSSGIKYEAHTQGASSSKGGMMTGSDGKNSQTLGPEKIELIVTRKKKFFVYGSFGFTVQRAKGEEGANFIYVEAVENQSPAQRAQVLPLDVILAVNGVSIADASVDKVNKLVASSADKIVLSVMTSSSYRVLTTQRDALSLLRNAQKETVVLSSAPTSHGGNRPCGLGILDVNVMDDKNRQPVRFFVLTHANVTSKNMKMVYPGDVVTHVDGTSLDLLSRDQVLQLLSTAKKEVTLTVVPLSPMRVKRIINSKFHETAMTDTNVASKSTGANIETS